MDSIDWLNSLIMRCVLCSNFIVYFLSLHAGLALMIKACLKLFWLRVIGIARSYIATKVTSAEC
jgi:hypothetical protein